MEDLEIGAEDDLAQSTQALRAMEQLKQSQHIQKTALLKVRQAEKDYLKTMIDIGSNLKVNQRWLAVCKTKVQLATMAMVRAVAHPDEKM